MAPIRFPVNQHPQIMLRRPVDRRRTLGSLTAEGGFDDASSTTSPDYASTRPSTDTQDSTDRPRAGVLKTVGDGSAGSSGAAAEKDYDIPEINFGRTLNYGAPLLQVDKLSSKDSSGRNDASRGALHSRSSSADLLSSGRPVSQGTGAVLSAGEMSSSLSAREQEHVARVTGTPLIAFATSKGPSQTQNGLVGAIEVRERERAQMKQGIGGQAVAQAIDQRQREQNQQAQRAAQAAYAQQQAQFAAQHGPVRPQTPGAMGMMMGGAPSVYGPQVPARPQTPARPPEYSGGMGMMAGGPPPTAYGPGMTGMGGRSMSPGPGMMGPGRFAQGPPTPRHQMMPQSPSYGGGLPQGGEWSVPSMPYRQGPPMPPPTMGLGMQGGRPQSPAFQLPPQGQYAPPGTPGGPRPGTPGRMQFQGQAF
ncbi:a4d2e58b-ce24-4229-b474-a0cba02b2f4f [Thermothielavioides terrestris]|uniref:A4d2e58b-ce24-4229-b474-a0cba02b2f4f n=1 Tax=Thermothielavioides terrestris TaxID=2587410 RepID=A0A3S4B1D3_9PEZI|nr:a4d2e58b-ce24-4229-b474-a0cba02b2f4f [Thermothielavioides terrestris]